MNRIFLLDPKQALDLQQVGGKAAGLHQLQLAGYMVPKTVCIASDVYDQFLDLNGLREKIELILNRKPQEEMRWEEIWDNGLRIKSLFHSASLPRELEAELSEFLRSTLDSSLVAVRSSATDEDQQSGSFAGLHESFLNISPERVLTHVKKVWASLWSDRALLYRQELGLSVEKSKMAVLVQEMLPSDVSGVCFTHDPLGSKDMVVEAVHGLNQGLVDGQIEPDRWFLDKTKSEIKQWVSPGIRSKKTNASEGVAILEKIPKHLQDKPPLTKKQLFQIRNVALDLYQRMEKPLDIEWTICSDSLFLLQARPISTLASDGRKDQRPWYLSLHRSYTNLVELKNDIENNVLPAMDEEAAKFAAIDPAHLDDHALAEEITHRGKRNEFWTDVYWKKCIPFAHGIRLFGEIYNELITPDDPYEFVKLLTNQDMLSTSRNQELHQLAAMLNEKPALKNALEQQGDAEISDPVFKKSFEKLFHQYGFLFPGTEENIEYRRQIALRIILEYTRLEPKVKSEAHLAKTDIEQPFLEKMDQAEYPFTGQALLDLARASYRIRDDDNIFLGKIELQANAAVNEARKRLIAKGVPHIKDQSPEELTRSLTGQKPNLRPSTTESSTATKEPPTRVKARQILGQPAAQGIAQGIARTVLHPEDLINFKNGEILVVESIDPNMTFVAPLAAAIVEKRGGMLIHGAIIAREYGIPCITGIPDATKLINTGDKVLVDGYLGIVTIDKK